MSYIEHPSFVCPNDDEILWRFMSFSKLCNMLCNNSLFFTKPKHFEDVWEGLLPAKYFDSSNYNLPPETDKKFAEIIVKSHKQQSLESSEKFGVNCWHLNSYEPEAFWKNYAKEEGVAIKTTFKKLKECFDLYKERDLFIGKVKYLDEQFGDVDTGNFFNRILWKRKSYEHENEVRAVIWESPPNFDGDPFVFENEYGHYVPINLNILVDEIITTPFVAGNWFNDSVNETIRKYGYNFKCRKSSLMERPF